MQYRDYKTKTSDIENRSSFLYRTIKQEEVVPVLKMLKDRELIAYKEKRSFERLVFLQKVKESQYNKKPYKKI